MHKSHVAGEKIKRQDYLIIYFLCAAFIGFTALAPHLRLSSLLPGALSPKPPVKSDSKQANLENPAVSKKTQAEDPLDNNRRAYGQLPLSFEVNKGQSAEQVRFLARGQGYGLLLTASGPVLSLEKKAQSVKQELEHTTEELELPQPDQRAVLSMHLVGAHPSPKISGVDELPGKVNYFVGNNPRKWRKSISAYSKVLYESVYPGIDVIYYGNQRQLEYDFLISPGADPRNIKLGFDGVSQIIADDNGDVVLTTAAGDIRQSKPFAYQEVHGERKEVAANYQVQGDKLSFEVGEYDKSQRLIIDPLLIYSTFLGGSGLEQGLAIAVDAQGSAYVTGLTTSNDFPLMSSVDDTKNGTSEIFIAKLNPTGTAFVYSTYLGGESNERGYAIAVDTHGGAYVAGVTFSSTFPTTPGALQISKDASADGFVAKLSPSGSSLTYSTYLGGDITDNVSGVKVDDEGRAYVVGRTDSTRFRTYDFPAPRNGSPAYKSTDAAGHWLASSSGLAATVVNGFATVLGNSNILYAASNFGVFKSTNAGASWDLTGSGDPSNAPQNVNRVVVDPSNPAIVYAAGDFAVYKSTDAGTRYELKGEGPLLPIISTIAIDPSTPTTLYAGTGFGIFKTTNSGETWVELRDGIVGQSPTVYEVVIDPTNPTIVYMGTNVGMFKSSNGGALWTSINGGALSGGFVIRSLAIDPLNPLILYAGLLGAPSGNFLVKSIDGGATWAASGMGLADTLVNDLAIDKLTPSTIYAATGNSIYKSIDSGGHWTRQGTGLPNSTATAVALDVNSSSTVYAATSVGGDVFAARINSAGSALEYLMNFGGAGNDEAQGVALDGDGNAYVTGFTDSLDFPVANAFQSMNRGGLDAFIAKINSAGTGFVYSTYLGGSGHDLASGIAVRGETPYVVGQTFSPDFPLVSPLKPSLAPHDIDAFVTKLRADGAALDYSTFLGGPVTDQATGVVLDLSGSAYVTGLTIGRDFPLVTPLQEYVGGNDAFLTKINPSGSAFTYSTYLGGRFHDQANGIAIDSFGNAYIIGNTNSTDFPMASPFQAALKGSDAFVAKIGASLEPNTIQFNASALSAAEGSSYVEAWLTRSATTATASVNYSTSDVTASQSSDYTFAAGTVQFAAGEISKRIVVLLIDDSHVEGPESFKLTLSNPNGAQLGATTVATINITDNDSNPNAPNPIDAAQFFVREHYYDFLNRLPDQAGLDYWTSQISACGNDVACVHRKRIDVSAAFYVELEFQRTGYVVYRLYRAAHGTFPNTTTRANVSYAQFNADRGQLTEGAQLQQSTISLANAFVGRPEFLQAYPNSLSNAQFVNKLFDTAQLVPYTTARQQQIDSMNNSGKTRAQVLLDVIEIGEFKTREYNSAFVLMQYFGYLRRDPDQGGYDFWLGIVNNPSVSNYRSMVCAFLTSAEYQQRFGTTVSRTDQDCAQL